MEVKQLGKKNLSETDIRNYLSEISKEIQKMSQQEELHVSGEKPNFYYLTGLSSNGEAFFVNLAIITTDERTQTEIFVELRKWLTEYKLHGQKLFLTHEWDENRRKL